MKTDELIRALAADTVRTRPLGLLVLFGLLPAIGFAAVMVWLVLGFRADLAQSLVTPVSAVRIVLTAALGAVALRLGLLLAPQRPTSRPCSTRHWPLHNSFRARATGSPARLFSKRPLCREPPP